MMSRRNLLEALALAPAVRLLTGAPQDPTPKFSAGVKVVNVFATVRDKKGQIVRDLNKEDFLLEEDGHPQTIRYFAREIGLPLTLGLLVDTSGSTRRVLPDERSAARRFLEQVLREDKDLAFIIHFDSEVELLQDLTPSRQKLEKALGELETGSGRPQWGQRGPYGRGGGRRGGRGGTSMYDAVLLASDELMKKQTGRKALVLLTDGVDNSSKVSLDQSEEAAQRADTLVYSILFEDPEMVYGSMPGGMGRRGGWGRPVPRMDRRDGKKVLQDLARNTGGHFFEVSKREPIQKVFADIEEDLRSQYNLGYSPDGNDSSGGFRRIHVTTREKGLVVQAREGYYPT